MNERAYIEMAAACLASPPAPPRQLWQPTDDRKAYLDALVTVARLDGGDLGRIARARFVDLTHPDPQEADFL